MTRSIYRNFLIVLVIDGFLVAFSWYVANLLRFNFEIPAESFAVMARLVPMMVGVKIITFYMFDLYRGMWRYTSIDDLLNILKAASVGSLIVFSIVGFTHSFTGFARASFVIDWILTIFLIGGYRISIRLLFWLGLKDDSSSVDMINMIRRLRGEKGKGKSF